MKLSSKGRYAVMALTDLAKFNLKDPVSLRDISLRQGISLVYLEQLFLKLKKNKIVKSIRGKKGGYVLNKKASEVKISDILLAVDEKIKTVGCKKYSKQGLQWKIVKMYYS
jgi:Rrf2 family protein